MNGCCYDTLIGPLERWRLKNTRRELLGALEGQILDLGAGTGANFAFFQNPSQVVAAEPDPELRRQADRRRPEGLTLLDSRAEDLPFDNESFDHVITTLVLCTVDDLEISLQQIHRVLKPEGRLHFLEHLRGDGFIGTLHDVCTPAWSKIAGGCHLNRRTLQTLRESGFSLEAHHTAFKFLGTPFEIGSARKKP